MAISRRALRSPSIHAWNRYDFPPGTCSHANTCSCPTTMMKSWIGSRRLGALSTTVDVGAGVFVGAFVCVAVIVDVGADVAVGAVVAVGAGVSVGAGVGVGAVVAEGAVVAV